jgi:hypothetical protein
VNASLHRQLDRRKRRILRRIENQPGVERHRPMLTASDIHYELSDRTRAISPGGIGAVQHMVQKLGLARDIDRDLHLLNPPGGRGVVRIVLSGLLAAWVGTLAEHLHGRNAWRHHRVVVGVILAQGRRAVTSWFRAAGITHDYRSYYYFLAAVGLEVQAIGLSLLDRAIQRVPITERLTLALDDTPTKRHGPEIEAAGRHHDPSPGPSGSKTLYGHNWVVLARLVKHAHSQIIGLPLRASLYVRQCDIPSRSRGVTPWEFQTKLELAATMFQATAESLEGRWDGPVWLLTDGGYAKRPVYAATKKAGRVMVTRLRRDAYLNDLSPVLKPGQKRGRGRPRIDEAKRIKLALRAGQKRGWKTIEVAMSQGQVKRWRSRRSWRPGESPVAWCG